MADETDINGIVTSELSHEDRDHSNRGNIVGQNSPLLTEHYLPCFSVFASQARSANFADLSSWLPST